VEQFQIILVAYRSGRNEVLPVKLLDHPAIPFIGRLLIVYIYATSGYAKVVAWQANVAYMSAHHLPFIYVLLAAATVIEIGGSICLVAGYRARWTAFIMFLYTTIVTLVLHNYWAYQGVIRGATETQFRKNLAIMGGLLLLSYAGAGAWSLDQRKRARASDRAKAEGA
jgi:putative oxidoreductase